MIWLVAPSANKRPCDLDWLMIQLIDASVLLRPRLHTIVTASEDDIDPNAAEACAEAYRRCLRRTRAMNFPTSVGCDFFFLAFAMPMAHTSTGALIKLTQLNTSGSTRSSTLMLWPLPKVQAIRESA